jgi:hypothetical protein
MSKSQDAKDGLALALLGDGPLPKHDDWVKELSNTYTKVVEAQRLKDKGWVFVETYCDIDERILPRKDEKDGHFHQHLKFKDYDKALKHAIDFTILNEHTDGEACIYVDGCSDSIKYIKRGEEVRKSDTDFL